MARSRNRYSRARIRARSRRPRRTQAQWFYGALALIVVLGVVGIVFTVADRGSADVPPQPGNASTGEPGDHWHAAFKVNLCGEWINDPATFEQIHDNPNVSPGIHTHGDGFVHIHPFTRSEGGDNATFGRFLDYGGWSISEDEIDLGDDQTAWPGLSVDPSKRTWTNGDECPASSQFAGKEGRVVWSVDCKARTGNPSDLKLEDHQVIAVGFLPKGEKLGVPPNADAAPSDDGGSTGPIDNKACSTAGPGGSTTTTAPAGTATTAPTTAPASTAPASSAP
jgi:hypothetical protein